MCLIISFGPFLYFLLTWIAGLVFVAVVFTLGHFVSSKSFVLVLTSEY
jgi:hypothetical protein